MIDNYDSFTYNLVQYLGELGAEPEVVRNDRATVEELLARGPDRLVVSPGPCTPAEAGSRFEAVRAFAEAGTPVLGVCLGHQSLVEAFGGRVIQGEPIHGKDAEVSHDGRSVYRGLPTRSSPAATTRWSPTPRRSRTRSRSAPPTRTWSWGCATASCRRRGCSSTPSRC